MKRIESFQTVRGIAIFLIFLSHCERLLYIGEANRLMYLGGFGVSLFIALSGFLEAYKYFEGGKKSEANRTPWQTGFQKYLGKWKKFGWLHIITLIVAIPFTLSMLRSKPLNWVITLAFNGALFQTWIPKSSVYFSFNAVSWYLSITLFFAIMTPIATKIWDWLDAKKMVAASIILLTFEIVFCLILRDQDYIHWVVYVLPFTRFLDFLYGGGIYRIAQSQKNQEVSGRKWLLLSSLILILLGITSGIIRNELFSTAAWTLPVTWLIAAVYVQDDGSNGKSVFHKLGDISFEFFMIHQLVIRYFSVIANKVNVPIVLAYIMALIVSEMGAYLLHYRKRWVRR